MHDRIGGLENHGARISTMPGRNTSGFADQGGGEGLTVLLRGEGGGVGGAIGRALYSK